MRAARRPLALFLLGSLAIHLAALPFVARVESPARPRALLAVREIELVPLPPGPPAPAEPATASLGDGAPRAQARAARRVPPRAAEPAPGPAGSPLLGMRGPGSEPTPAVARRLDLTPSVRTLLGEGGAPGAAAARRSGRERPGAFGLGEAEQTKRNLDEILARERDRQDLVAGRVHPFLYRLARTAEGTFHPGWSLVESDRLGRGSLKTSYRNLLVGLGKQYLAELERYRNGFRENPAAADQGKMLEGYNKLLEVAARNASTMACELCVRFELRGEPPEVRLRRRSGNRAFDQLALASMQRSARLEQRPVDAPPTEACYEYSARFHRVPPLPAVGCSFDESKPSISCFYPTKKILRAGVRLVSIRRPAPKKS